MNQRMPIRFAGTGAYMPDEVITNEHFADYLDTSDEWIQTRTGIRERRKSTDDEYTSVLARKASERALADAGMDAKDLDLIICATATPDYLFPSTASIIQGQLGATNAGAFDISAVCAGFMHAGAAASGLITSGIHKTVLVIGAERLTRFIDNNERGTVVIFGDGAGAAILTKSSSPDQAVLYCNLGCDGTRTEDIWLPAGGSRFPACQATIEGRQHYMHMRGRDVYKFAVVKIIREIERALKETGLKASDLKLVIPHQSNLRIIESVRDKMGLPMEQFAVNIDKYGNTSAASVPVAFDEARRDGRVGEGDLVLMIALGAGLTWGTMIIQL
jgi:3-oxoacyl-[acyl-carrier-protein] synthase-3